MAGLWPYWAKNANSCPVDLKYEIKATNDLLKSIQAELACSLLPTDSPRVV
jgi:hypothetical protein